MTKKVATFGDIARMLKEGLKNTATKQQVERLQEKLQKHDHIRTVSDKKP